MTPDEAIKLNNELLNLLPEVGFNKYLCSVQLGIEALKYIKWRREFYLKPRILPLPGETKE